MSIQRSFAVLRPLLSFFDGLSDPAKGIALALTSNALLILVGIIVRELSQTIEWQWPTWSELALLVLVGVISSIGQ